MSWTALTIDLPEDLSDSAQLLMHEQGAAGLEVRDGQHLVNPAVRAPQKGEAIIIAYFEDPDRSRAARAALLDHMPEARTMLHEVVERDWSVEWRARIRSVTVGRLWVGPPWERPRAPADKVRLFIEPKMAFGTGDHPTTSLCLAAVDDFMAAHPKATVLDVGTGTGVLAMAAKKLGASTVVATDNDPVAVELAVECAQENGVTGIDFSTRPLELVTGAYDLVVANILANTLVELAPLIAPKVKRRLVLAGVLAPQAAEVSAAYQRLGLRPHAETVQGEWVRLELDAGPRRAPRRKKTAHKAKTASRTRARAQKKLAAGKKKGGPRSARR